MEFGAPRLKYATTPTPVFIIVRLTGYENPAYSPVKYPCPNPPGPYRATPSFGSFGSGYLRIVPATQGKIFSCLSLLSFSRTGLAPLGQPLKRDVSRAADHSKSAYKYHSTRPASKHSLHPSSSLVHQHKHIQIISHEIHSLPRSRRSCRCLRSPGSPYPLIRPSFCYYSC